MHLAGHPAHSSAAQLGHTARACRWRGRGRAGRCAAVPLVLYSIHSLSLGNSPWFGLLFLSRKLCNLGRKLFLVLRS